MDSAADRREGEGECERWGGRECEMGGRECGGIKCEMGGRECGEWERECVRREDVLLTAALSLTPWHMQCMSIACRHTIQ